MMRIDIIIILITHHAQNRNSYDRYRHVDEYGQPPLSGDGVDGGEQQRTAEEEHVRGRHKGAPEFRFTHFAYVRRKRAARESNAQTHHY